MSGRLWPAAPGGGELAGLLRQLSTLVQAGVPLTQALACLQDGALSVPMRRALHSIGLALECGDSFSRALARFPLLFPADLRLAVAAAEEGGQMASTLAYLAAAQEGRVKVRARVRQALIYPCLILLSAVAVVSTVCATVVPALSESFSASGQALPASTQAVVATTEWVSGHAGWLLLLALSMFWSCRLAWRRVPAWRARLFGLALHLPLLGRLLREAALARWSRTLGLLLSAGVPLLSALPVAGEAAGDPVLAGRSVFLAGQVREGCSLLQALRLTRGFPPLLQQLVRVGEHSGTLAEMFDRAAEYFSTQVDETLATLTALLEPLAMMLLGLICGGLIWTLYLPIFQLAETVA